MPKTSVQASASYFGRTDGSPPGLPGGGITGVLPVSGVGARISGSTPDGGHKTPSDLASLSPSGSRLWPVVEPSGATVPCAGADCVCAQLAEPFAATGGATSAVGVGTGDCAATAPQVTEPSKARVSACLICMTGKRRWRADVPAGKCGFIVPSALKTCGSGSVRNAPSAASGGVPSG
jgi:hypothetical protein